MEQEKIFRSFSEASAFARELGKEGKKNNVKRNDLGGWVVKLIEVDIDGNEAMREILADIDLVISRKDFSQEDCDDFIATVKELLPKVTDSTIIANSLRIVRTLEQKRSTLSTREISSREKTLRAKERSLEMQAPLCSRCNVRMLLQKTKRGSYMWGCKNFSLPPKDKCFINKRLLDREWDMLGLPKTD